MDKMHRSSIPRVATTRAENLLGLVHTDVAGPLAIPSKGGARYFVTSIDDNSCWVTAFPIISKSDCFFYFQKHTWGGRYKPSDRMGEGSIYRTSSNRF